MRWITTAGALILLLYPLSANAQPKLPPPGGKKPLVTLPPRPPIQNAPRMFPPPIYSNSRLNVSAYFGGTTVYQYGLIGPPVCGNWYGFASPWIAPPPMFGPPPPFFFGANPFFLTPPSPVIISPQIIVQQQPIVQARADVPFEPVKVANPERFIVIQPGMPVNNAGVNPARVEKPVKEVDLGVRPADLPLAPRRAANPLADADRRMEDGRAAFARGEYGRALEHFRRAVQIAPAESAGYFLLSQAQFAVGKYDEAVGSVTLGIELRRDWPMSQFSSRGLYKQNAAAFDFHIRNLRTALEEAPNDPRLLFLLGVQLWFDDKRDEARLLLEKAARFARDPAPILPFLGK